MTLLNSLTNGTSIITIVSGLSLLGLFAYGFFFIRRLEGKQKKRDSENIYSPTELSLPREVEPGRSETSSGNRVVMNKFDAVFEGVALIPDDLKGHYYSVEQMKEALEGKKKEVLACQRELFNQDVVLEELFIKIKSNEDLAEASKKKLAILESKIQDLKDHEARLQESLMLGSKIREPKRGEGPSLKKKSISPENFEKKEQRIPYQVSDTSTDSPASLGDMIGDIIEMYATRLQSKSLNVEVEGLKDFEDAKPNGFLDVFFNRFMYNSCNSEIWAESISSTGKIYLNFEKDHRGFVFSAVCSLTPLSKADRNIILNDHPLIEVKKTKNCSLMFVNNSFRLSKYKVKGAGISVSRVRIVSNSAEKRFPTQQSV